MQQFNARNSHIPECVGDEVVTPSVVGGSVEIGHVDVLIDERR